MTEQTTTRIYLCGGPTCAPHNLPGLLDALEIALWDQELDNQIAVQISGCQNRCHDAPNLMIYPGPRRYAQLTCASLSQIIATLRPAPQ